MSEVKWCMGKAGERRGEERRGEERRGELDWGGRMEHHCLGI